MAEKMLKIKLVRSPIGYDQTQKDTAKGLGLTRMNKVVVKRDRPQIRGMVAKIIHMLEVEEFEQ